MTNPATQTHCLNCDQKLIGNFCHICGQEKVDIKITFTELTRDFFGDMFTYDSRFYRTILPLLFKPGFLTRQFFVGKRIPYVPPLRLYLFISFILFLWLAITGSFVNVGTGEPEMAQAAADEINAELEDSEEIEAAKELMKLATNNWVAIQENPEAFTSLLASRLPYLMFLLLPIFAILIWIHFPFSGFNYLQHFVFTLHVHAFVFLSILLLSIATIGIDWDFSGLMLLAILIYNSVAIHKAYGAGVAASIAKTLSISFAYLIVIATSFIAFLLVNLLDFD